MKIPPVYFYVIALIGFFGLFSLLMLWHTVFVTTHKLPIALILLVTVTPLLFPLRGFLAQQKKSCAWMAYISLGYFLHGSAEAYVNQNNEMYAIIEVIFSLMLFFGSSLYIYFSGKQR